MKIRDTLILIILFLNYISNIRGKFPTSFFLIFLSITSTALASNYYVSPNGDNTNPGTINSPFKTINYGVSKISAGDILYVRGGTYVERVSITQAGSEVSPITIMAYPGEFPVIDGQNSLPEINNSALVTIYSSYVYFIGFEVKNCDMTAHRGGNIGILLAGTHNLLSYCKVHETWDTGICSTGDYNIVEYCEVYNTCMSNYEGALGGAINGAGLTACHSSFGILRHNNVHDNWGEGLSSWNSYYHTLEDNIVYNNWSVNFYVQDAQDCLVQRNLVYQTKDMIGGSQAGIFLGDENNLPSARNTVINNIVYNTKQNFSVGGMDGVIIANNTFVNSTSSYGVVIFDASYTNSIFKNNIVVQENNYNPIATSHQTGLIFSNNLYNKSYDANAIGIGDIINDPLFINTGSTDAGLLTGHYYDLTGSSPAIDKGTTVQGVTSDFFEVARIIIDIGATEYVGKH